MVECVWWYVVSVLIHVGGEDGLVVEGLGGVYMWYGLCYRSTI